VIAPVQRTQAFAERACAEYIRIWHAARHARLAVVGESADRIAAGATAVGVTTVAEVAADRARQARAGDAAAVGRLVPVLQRRLAVLVERLRLSTDEPPGGATVTELHARPYVFEPLAPVGEAADAPGPAGPSAHCGGGVVLPLRRPAVRRRRP
jgi:hypothetical protein